MKNKRVEMLAEEKNLVSIIVPVYNAELYLKETLDCLAKQTYLNIEVLLIDDGSTDGSREICEEFAVKDSRFKYVWQENAGAGEARNNGMEMARGEFLMFLDADDLFEPQLVERLFEAIEKEKADVAICRGDRFFSEYYINKSKLSKAQCQIADRTLTQAEIAAIFFQCVTSRPWDKIFKTSHVRNCGFKFQSLQYSNDGFFVLLTTLKASKVTWISDILVHYRVACDKSLRDTTHLNPTCDLEMLDALRGWIIANYENCTEDLISSLDAFTIDLLMGSYLTFAVSSGDACEDFFKNLTHYYLPKWEKSEGSPIRGNSVKRKIKWMVVSKIYPKEMVQLAKPFREGGIRMASSRQWKQFYIRCIPYLLKAAASRSS